VTSPATATDDDGSGEENFVKPDLLLPLRGWQKEAYREYFLLPRRDFLLAATPGAGKTAWALTVAAELLARREVAAVAAARGGAR
jgi:superfamily II DNA or RNA helicase